MTSDRGRRQPPADVENLLVRYTDWTPDDDWHDYCVELIRLLDHGWNDPPRKDTS